MPDFGLGISKVGLVPAWCLEEFSVTARLLIASMALLVFVGNARVHADDPPAEEIQPATITGKIRDAAPAESEELPTPVETYPVIEESPAEEMEAPSESTPDGPEQVSTIVEPMEVEDAFQQPCCLIDDFNVAYPLWFVRGDLMYLNRTSDGNLTTATVRNGDGSLGNNRITSMPFGYEPGMRVFAGRNVWDGLTFIELGYFGLNHWSTTRGLTTESGLVSSNLDMGFGTPGNSNVTTQTQGIQYSSTLHNVELNARSYFNPNFALITGLRFTNLSETLQIKETGIVQITSGNTANPFNYDARRVVQIQNCILGPQIGTDIFWEITDDIRVGGSNRFLLGANFTKSSIHQSRDAFNSTLDSRIQGSRAQYDEEAVITGVLDLQATFDVRLTKNIVFKGGYQFLWLYNAAVAPTQGVNDITIPNGPQRQIENHNSAIFFGPYAGLEVSWGRFD